MYVINNHNGRPLVIEQDGTPALFKTQDDVARAMAVGAGRPYIRVTRGTTMRAIIALASLALIIWIAR